MFSNRKPRANRALAAILMATSLLWAGSATATVFNLSASMDSAQVVGGGGSTSAGIGFATITLNDNNRKLKWNMTWSGLETPALSLHFHGNAPPGGTAGVQIIVTLTGSLPNTGQAILSANKVAKVLAGKWYINLHTNRYPSGEIRGQITVVPEPTTITLMAGGLAVMAISRKRTRN
jgi:hypothetical protein